MRYYEKEGLMPTPKREPSSDYRIYDEEDINRLLNIVQLRSLGFGISEIKKYIHNTFTKEEKIHSLKNIIDVCNMQIALIRGVLDTSELPEIVVRERYDFYGITRTLDIGEPAEITNHFNEIIDYAKKKRIPLQPHISYMARHDFSTGKLSLILPVNSCKDELIVYYPKKKIISAYYNGCIENFGNIIS
ncbi:MAG: MerR family transcriptional regulator [Roseburia sp.]